MTSRRERTCTAHETLTFFDRLKEGSGLSCRLYRPEGLLEEPEGELGIAHWEEVLHVVKSGQSSRNLQQGLRAHLPL